MGAELYCSLVLACVDNNFQSNIMTDVEKITTKIILFELLSSKVIAISDIKINSPVNSKIAL